MGLLILKTDFSLGKFKIAKDNFTDVDSYIDRYEEPMLIDLLGIDLFKLFKADVASHVPVSAIYLTIFNAISSVVNGCNIESNGMKDMLQGVIYFQFERDNKFKNTISGATVNEAEVGRSASFDESNMAGRYNESIKTYNAIQEYLRANKTVDYPTYKGVGKNITHWCL